MVIGQRVRTLKPLHNDQYTRLARALRKWGVTGTIEDEHDSHGLCYDVHHDDDTYGSYDPDEIEPEQKRKTRYDIAIRG